MLTQFSSAIARAPHDDECAEGEVAPKLIICYPGCEQALLGRWVGGEQPAWIDVLLDLADRGPI
jgi:hypothetical protein